MLRHQRLSPSAVVGYNRCVTYKLNFQQKRINNEVCVSYVAAAT